MTVITPGVDATLKSDNAEGQLLELAAFFRFNEQLTTTNPTNRIGVSVNCNLSTFTSNITFSLTAQPGINSIGQPITSASVYLQNTGFTPGVDGTFKSTTPEAYFWNW
jgi:hypothetical protein